VVFSTPEKFTDVKEDSMGSDKGRDGILDQLREYLVLQTRNSVPEGQTLKIMITDVDMAGDFEPWHGPSTQDVRIIRDIYPPKIDLFFTLTDASGKTVKEGKRQLRDMAFNMKISINRNDPLRYEKELLNDWLRQDLPRAKGG
jgi:hypothetical protein